jgi:hypothetical protein
MMFGVRDRRGISRISRGQINKFDLLFGHIEEMEVESSVRICTIAKSI